ncbi:hypothetical protein N7528_006807 [Penicillium herquei]|nr:hypothetical protein N7528_006807 [Penicillium herquei]
MSSSEIEEFTLGSSTDIVIMVSESENEEPPLSRRKKALFRLKKESLSKNSDFFKAMLPVANQDPRWFDIQRQKDLFKALVSKQWKHAVEEHPEIEDHIITLYGDNIKSMRIWFSVFHNQEIDPAEVSIKEIWHTIRAADKYGIDREKLEHWFGKWVKWFRDKKNAEWNKLDVQRELLFPCNYYDHAEAFRFLSRNLVYESDEHIFENNPIHDHRLRLRPLVIQQMNNARGRLRTILQRGLFNGIQPIFSSECSCKEITVFDFLQELVRLDVWCPWSNVFYRSSISQILERLEDFDAANIRRPNRDCYRCNIRSQSCVEAASEKVAGYFDGMCLDCMKQEANPRSEYWRTRRYERYERYDDECRIRHGEPSWYFSFMGKRERSQFQER